MSEIDFGRFEVLTFDCYGTLIDWEAGITAALQPVFASRDISVGDDRLLEAFGRHEWVIEAGPYRRYRDVLAETLRRICGEHGFEPDETECARFAASVGEWPAFDDSAGALTRLKERFRLGVITNCDDDLFARSNERLGIRFDWIVTAEQARSYKPSQRNFELAFERVGLPRDRILHVAQSLFHDHVTARELGLASAWIDRRRERDGSGATPTASATPSVTYPDMATFAAAAIAAGGTGAGE